MKPCLARLSARTGALVTKASGHPWHIRAEPPALIDKTFALRRRPWLTLRTLATIATAEESVRLNRRVLILTVIVGILTALTAVRPVSELVIGLLNLIAPGAFPVTSPTPAP